MRPFCLLLLAVFCLPATAQTLRIDRVHVHVAERDTTANTVPVTFEVAWDGSWRDGETWDAAWVFAKFEREPGVWADLRFTAEGATATGTASVVADPLVLPAGHAGGLLVHRAEDGRGDVRLSVRATWTYGASFFALPPDGVPVRVLGVEMVRVPSGPFEVGESVADSLRQPHAFQSSTGDAYRVASEDAIPVGPEAGALSYTVAEGEAYIGGDQSGPIPAAFPKGTEAFYVMKLPVTQRQYADFLSLLPPRARAAR
ncbi:MAG: hypothetical protein AAF791_01415, partial [Bacteroidota bacterium]